MIGYMLRFEAALARAKATHGLIPNEAAVIIADCCLTENINKEKLILDAALGWNVAIPLVKGVDCRCERKRQ